MYQQIDLTKLKYCFYQRKSTESEDRQMLSLSSQEDECNSIAKYYKLQNLVACFQESKSAKMAGLRPEFTKMKNMINHGEINAIVCWHINRLARNMTEGGILIDYLSEGKLVIITPTEVYDENSDAGLLSYHFGASKQFSKNLSKDVKRGQKKKANLGIPHGVASLGFLNDKTDEKGNRKWLVDEMKLKAIKIIFDMFLTGTYSAGKLHRFALKELKLTTVKRKRIGGAFITLSRIYEILKDPIYAGFFFQGGVRYELDTNLPRLITEDEHNKVKVLLAKKNIPKAQHNEATFAGFVQSDKGDFMGQDVKYQLICDCKKKFCYLNKTHCPKCGKEIEQMENPKYLIFTYYYNVKRKKAYQGYISVSESKIMEKLLDFVDKNLTFSQDLADWSRQYITELKDKEINDSIFRKQKGEANKIEYESKKSRLRQMLRDEQITDDEYKTDLEDLNKKYAVVDGGKEAVDWYSKMNEIVDLTLCTKEVLEKGTMQTKRNILSRLGSNLVWNEEILNIHNKKSIEKLVEGIKRTKLEFPEFEPKNWVADKSLNEKTGPFLPAFSTMLRG